MLIFVQRDSDMCVCPTEHMNNDRKAFYEHDCERNQKFYVEVFLTREIVLSCCSIVKNYGEMFFSNFILPLCLAIDARLHQKTESVWKTNTE